MFSVDVQENNGDPTIHRRTEALQKILHLEFMVKQFDVNCYYG